MTRVIPSLILVLALGGVARADATALARERFQRGTVLYDLGRYVEAAREYEAAYASRSDPALLFNAGQAYRLGGDAAGAHRSYRAYLRLGVEKILLHHHQRRG